MEEGNILHTIQGRKANCNGNILDRNCLPKHITGGTTGVRYVDGKMKKEMLSSYWMILKK